MALQILNTTLTTAGNAIDLGAVDSVFIGGDGLAASTGASGIIGTGSNHHAHIQGAVVGNTAVSLGDDGSVDMNDQVFVAATGGIFGRSFGIYLAANASLVTNQGVIEGYMGVYMAGFGPFTQARIENGGTIHGVGYGILSEGDEALSILNYGIISGGEFNSIYASGLDDSLRNRGALYGDVALGSGNDRMDNREGSVAGDVALGSGNDTLDNRGGTIDGTVFGEGGDDTFFAGAEVEVFDGGIGIDTLNVKSSTGGRIDLSGAETGTGVALGDSYIGIENVLGSTSGGDTIIGSAAANVLYGFGGADVLRGGGGTDVLDGGTEADTLAGGLGNDIFRFRSLDDIGDAITDFSGVAGNDDVFRISAAAFGGGLVAGALSASQFRSRADNLAQDADDRFIFRTTDQTLWFDANGNVAGGLTQIADLQTGAVMTAADIFLI